MIQVAYTNSNCSDLWEMFINQNKKHTTIDLFIITDKEIPNFDIQKQFIYTNDQPYYQVWIEALKKFNTEYFIYLQEDFILYEDVNNRVFEYLDILKSSSKYSFIRLIKSGQLESKEIFQNLFEIEPNNRDIFSMQPTIWKTNKYIDLLNEVQDTKWFENHKYIDACINQDLYGLYHYDNEKKRGLNHYDSSVYPYIATALVRSKWNLGEYPVELGKILAEYNIDYKIRGIYS